MVVNDAQTIQYDNEYGLLQNYRQGENIFEEGSSSIEGEIEKDVYGDIKIEIKEEAIVDEDETGGILKNSDISSYISLIEVKINTEVNSSIKEDSDLHLGLKECLSNNLKNNLNNIEPKSEVSIVDKNLTMLDVNASGINQDTDRKQCVSSITAGFVNDKAKRNSEVLVDSDRNIHNTEDIIDVPMYPYKEEDNEQCIFFESNSEIGDVFIEDNSVVENPVDKLSKSISNDEGCSFLSNLKNDSAMILCNIQDNFLQIDEESCVRPEPTINKTKNDSCDILSDILNNTELNNTTREGDILESRMNRNFSIYLERSTKCVEKIYKKLLDTSKELRVNLKRENLFLLQKLYKREQFMQRCASCPYITKVKVNLINHMNRHKGKIEKMVHTCPYCNVTSLYKPSMKNYIRFIHKAHKVESFKCNKSKFKTVYKSTLRSHLLMHSKSRKLYKCELCSFQTSHKSVFLNHKSDKSRIFNCAHCSYKSETKETLKKHLLVHRRPKVLVKYCCDKCSYQTISKDGIRNHQQVHKAREELILAPCSLCPYKGRTKDHLRTHLLIHHNSSPSKMYSCKKCSYKSKSSCHMRRHSLVHMDDKESYCNRIHVPKPKENIPLHVCDQCGLQFKQKWVLKKHIVSHEYPGRTNSIDLKDAEKLHCYHCSYSTKRKGHLEQHMPMHKNVFIHCEECEFQTRYINCYNRHKRNKH